MKITKKSIVFLIAGLLALIGFCMMFVSPLKSEAELFGKVETLEYAWQDIYMGTETPLGKISGATGALIGFILMLVGALGTVVLALVGSKLKKAEKLVALLLAVLILVGAILVFCTKALYCSANGYTSELSKAYKLNAGPIVGGILGLLSTGTTLVGGLLKK